MKTKELISRIEGAFPDTSHDGPVVLLNSDVIEILKILKTLE